MSKKVIIVVASIALVLLLIGLGSSIPSNTTNGDVPIDNEIIMRLGYIVSHSKFERLYVYSGIASSETSGMITMLYIKDIVYGGMGASTSIHIYLGDTVYLFDEPYEVVKLQRERVELRRIS